MDRGQHSLETITLLLALKASFCLIWILGLIRRNCFPDNAVFHLHFQIEYPENVHLIRGNHEAADINALFGFRLECIERMVLINMQTVVP